MLLGLLLSLALSLAGVPATEDTSAPQAESAAVARIDPATLDVAAERELLALTNRARARAELPPLQLDPEADRGRARTRCRYGIAPRTFSSVFGRT